MSISFVEHVNIFSPKGSGAGGYSIRLPHRLLVRVALFLFLDLLPSFSSFKYFGFVFSLATQFSCARHSITEAGRACWLVSIPLRESVGLRYVSWCFECSTISSIRNSAKGSRLELAVVSHPACPLSFIYSSRRQRVKCNYRSNTNEVLSLKGVICSYVQ